MPNKSPHSYKRDRLPPSTSPAAGVRSGMLGLPGQDLLLRMVEQATAAMAIVSGPDHRFLFANRAYRALAGDAQADLRDRPLREVLPHEAVGGRVPTLDLVYERNEAVHFHELRSGAGSFWDIDHIPLHGAGAKIEGVLIVASDVTEQVETRRRGEAAAAEAARRTEEAEGARRMLDALMRYIPEGVIIASAPDAMIERVSEYGIAMTQRPAEQLSGIPAERHPSAWDVFHADGTTPALAEELPLTRATRRGEIVTNEEWVLRRADGRLVPILCNAGPIRDAGGTITGGILVWRDIDAMKQAEAERESLLTQKDLLLKEVHHRVKNSLQLVGSLLRLQGHGVDDEAVRAQFDEATTRVSAIAQVHQSLYENDGAQTVEFARYLRSLATDLSAGLFNPGVTAVVREAVTVELRTDVAIPLALATSELVTNALKYAYPGSVGTVELSLNRVDDEMLCLSVADHGVGLPEGFDPLTGGNLGMRLVRSLVRQLGGTVSVERLDPGTRFMIELKPG